MLTNFFLITYTLTNLSAALLELSGCPNFRPTWRYYSWSAGPGPEPEPEPETLSRTLSRTRKPKPNPDPDPDPDRWP